MHESLGSKAGDCGDRWNNRGCSRASSLQMMIRAPNGKGTPWRVLHMCCRRCLHSSGGSSGIPDWPRSSRPTPYEIFNTTPTAFDKKELKKTFYAMAKAYHPDTQGIIGGLSYDVRVDRFKKISAAYEILKDDSKRRAFDGRQQFSRAARASTSGSASWDPFYGFDPSYAGHPDFEAARSRNYDHTKYRKAADEKFQQDLREGTKQLFILFCIAVGVLGIVETAALFRLSDWAKARSDTESYRLGLEVERARRNYDLGLMPDDRIARFLAARESTAYYQDGPVLPAPTTALKSSRS